MSSGSRFDCGPVTVCFQDSKIGLLFAELISASGLQTRLLRDIRDFDGRTRIITEPYFFPRIPEECHGQCLVVGDRESLKGVSALCLCRPLTEEKVETALSRFLSNTH